MAGFLPVIYLSLTGINGIELDHPVSLNTGSSLSASFRTPIEGRYDLILRFDDKQKDPRLPCETGVYAPSIDCSMATTNLKTMWSITGQKLSESVQMYDDNEGSIVGREYQRYIGIFKGNEGGNYRLAFKVTQGAPDLNGYHPHIVISITPGYAEAEAGKFIWAIIFLSIFESLGIWLWKLSGNRKHTDAKGMPLPDAF